MKPDLVISTVAQNNNQEIPFHESMRQTRIVMDFKTTSGGKEYREKAAKRGFKEFYSSRCGAGVTARGNMVNREYLSKATALDKKIATVYPGAPKCVTCVTQYGRIYGPAVGPFAEVSPDFVMLTNFVAAAQTNKALASSTYSGGKWKLYALHKHRLVQRWGLFFHRGWARLLDARIADLYGTLPEPDDSRGYSEERREQLQAHFILSSIRGDRMSDDPLLGSDEEEEGLDAGYDGGVFAGSHSK